MGYTDTRFLLGHQVKDPTGRSYLKPDYPHLKRLYYRNMDAVTLFDRVEVHDVTDDRVKELERQNRQILELLEMEGLHIGDLEKYHK